MQRTAVTPGSAEDVIALIDDETACVVVQSPDVFGLIRNLKPIAEAAHAKGALLIAVVTEIVSLGLLEPPGAQGADIVAAEGQSIGNGLNFGGPYVGLFATREKYPAPDAGPPVRRDGGCRRPPRLCADAVDARAAYPPRKGDQQHLHQFRPLLHPGFHHPSVLLGEEGLTRLARINHAKAVALAGKLAALPASKCCRTSFLQRVHVKLPKPAGPVVDMPWQPKVSSPACPPRASCRMTRGAWRIC